MKFFVTGGAGFIGSVLVNRLIKENQKVTVYDNFSNGKKRYLTKLNNSNLKIVKGDILDFKKLQKAMKGHDVIFHFAANSNIPAGLKNSRLDFEQNTVGTLNVLESMVKNQIKKLVFASTSTVFGTPNKFPTSEVYGPSLPESFYGSSKLASEGYISVFSNLYDIKAWIFRFANITGSPATHGIIFDFMKKLRQNDSKFEVLGDGEQKKSYLTNEMLIDGTLHVIKKTQKTKDKVLIFNIGNKDSIKVKHIAKIFLKMKKSDKKIVYTGGKGGWKGDVPLMRLDIRKILETGWKPNMNSKQCIISSISNYWD